MPHLFRALANLLSNELPGLAVRMSESEFEVITSHQAHLAASIIYIFILSSDRLFPDLQCARILLGVEHILHPDKACTLGGNRVG